MATPLLVKIVFRVESSLRGQCFVNDNPPIKLQPAAQLSLEKITVIVQDDIPSSK